MLLLTVSLRDTRTQKSRAASACSNVLPACLQWHRNSTLERCSFRDLGKGSVVVGWGEAPEDLKECFAVGNDLVPRHESVTVNGHCVALHAEVAAQLHIETHLHAHARTSSTPTQATYLRSRPLVKRYAIAELGRKNMQFPYHLKQGGVTLEEDVLRISVQRTVHVTF